MALSAEQLRQLAALSYLQLEDEVISPLTQDLNAIIDFVTQLQAVDTDGVEALRSPVDAYQRLRADEAQAAAPIEALANIAPSFKDNLYLVPKVITAK